MTKRMDVITGVDYERNGEKKTRWSRIGVAFANDKGGWDVNLDALPCNGRLKLVEPKPRDSQSDAAEPSGDRPPF